MITLQAAAEELVVSVRTLRRWSARGYIKLVVLPSGRLRIEDDEVERIRAEVTTGSD